MKLFFWGLKLAPVALLVKTILQIQIMIAIFMLLALKDIQN